MADHQKYIFLQHKRADHELNSQTVSLKKKKKNMLHKYTILKIPGSIPGTNLVTVMVEGPSSFLIYFKNTVDRNGDVERFDVGG